MGKPQLEFTDGRPPYTLAAGATVIGRAATSSLALDAAGVQEQHCRIVLDPKSGSYWLEDMKSKTGTLRNGERITAKVWLSDGDRIEIGAVTLLFRPEGAEVVQTEQSTMISMEPPEAVKELIRKKMMEEAAAAGGAPEPRTMQMDAPDYKSLGLPPPGAPPSVRSTKMGTAPSTVPEARSAAAAPAPRPPAPAPRAPSAPAPMAVAPRPVPARPAPAPRPVAAAPVPDAQNPFATQAEMPAPVLPPTPQTPDAQNPFATQAEMPAPVLPAKRPPPQPAAFAATAAFDAPANYAAPTGAKPAPFGNAQPPFGGPQSGFTPPLGNAQHPKPFAATMAAPAPAPPAADANDFAAFTPAPGYSPQPSLPPGALAEGSPAPSSAGSFGQGAPLVYPDAASYQPPAQKGALGSISRALAFYGQMFSLAFKHKVLLAPLLYDLVITTPISIGLGIIFLFVNSEAAFYGVLALGTAMLYFVDYACNSLTASLIYDQVTTGQATTKGAFPRVTRVLSGIVIFASVSALLDVASTYARERRDPVARILVDILRKIWTTATYVIMPSMVLEGLPFGKAFERSKSLMAQDPTGVGAGVVALSLTSYLAGLIIFPLAYFCLRLGWSIHLPTVGAILFFTLVNLYWSVSGWTKIAYSTLFYVWASECAKSGSQEHSLAPVPLRAALDAA